MPSRLPFVHVAGRGTISVGDEKMGNTGPPPELFVPDKENEEGINDAEIELESGDGLRREERTGGGETEGARLFEMIERGEGKFGTAVGEPLSEAARQKQNGQVA